LELDVVDRHDGELLGRHTVALGGVSVSREGGPGVAALARRKNDRATDPLRQRLLEDAAIDDLDRDRSFGHALLPPIRRRIPSPTALICSAAARRPASASCAPSAARKRRCASSGACSRLLLCTHSPRASTRTSNTTL